MLRAIETIRFNNVVVEIFNVRAVLLIPIPKLRDLFGKCDNLLVNVEIIGIISVIFNKSFITFFTLVALFILLG